MKKIKVSVIVITYNHEKYVKDALNSIFNQKTNFEYELLICDDASTDNTQNEIRKICEGKKEVRLFLRKNNVGATKNLYDLFNECNGEYVAMLEGDDYWIDDNKLQRTTDFLDKNKSYIGVSHKINGVDVNGNFIKAYPTWVKKDCDASLGKFLKCKYFSCVQTVFRSEVIKLMKKDNYESVFLYDRLVGDLPMSIYLLNKGKIKVFFDSLSAYRTRNQAGESNYNSLKNNYQKGLEHIKLINAIKKFYPNLNYQNLYNEWLLVSSYYLIKTKNTGKLKKQLKEIVDSKVIFKFYLMLPYVIIRKMLER